MEFQYNPFERSRQSLKDAVGAMLIDLMPVKEDPEEVDMTLPNSFGNSTLAGEVYEEYVDPVAPQKPVPRQGRAFIQQPWDHKIS